MWACCPTRFVQSIHALHGPTRKTASAKQISLSVIVVLVLPKKKLSYWQEPSLNRPTMTYLCLHERVADCMCGHIDDVLIFFFVFRDIYSNMLLIHGHWSTNVTLKSCDL